MLPIFQIIEQQSGVPDEELYQVFNMGIGMVAVVSPNNAKRVMSLLKAKRIGRIERGSGKTRLVL
jgi:phosphoribosylformylglycinamidine cyclo-ligase